MTISWRAIALAVTALTVAGSARAAPLDVTATPILGADAPSTPGWVTYLVRLHNPSPETVVGAVELEGAPGASTRSPFSLAPGQRSALELSWHDLYGTDLSLRTLDANGRVLGEHSVLAPRGQEPLLFDVSAPSRIAPALRGRLVPIRFSPPATAPVHAPTLAVTSPETDSTTGDPILPRRASGYSSVTVAVLRTETLAALDSGQLQALGDWVLSGGSLALAVTRPEDLRTEPLSILIGGAAHVDLPQAQWQSPMKFRVPTDAGSGSTGFVERSLAPQETTRSRLTGFAGGNLRATQWGATATYGLGEVHLLAFDPTTPSFVEDEWVRLSLVDLVRYAWDRRAQLAIPHGAMPLKDYRVAEVRRVLDPNEGARWAVVVSAIALIFYAMLAGPLNFSRARRKGQPLRALSQLPIFSAVALAFVVVTGVVAKGQGRARRLTLVEAGGGMTRAAATRFRAFYASSVRSLTVPALEPSSMLDLVGEADEASRTLIVDRFGARLEHFVTRPWQTMLVREDGFISLSGGVSLVASPDGDVFVKNRAARDLLAVVIQVPNQPLRYFDRITDGAVVRASSGETLPTMAPPLGPKTFPAVVMNTLEAYRFSDRVEKASKGLGNAWRAIEAVSGSAVDFWPHDVPVLIAQLDGGEGRMSDAGLRLEMDRILLRVVGYGGVP